MEIASRIFTVELAEPFVISRSTTSDSDIVQVAITHDGVTGYGEGAPDDRYGESCQSAIGHELPGPPRRPGLGYAFGPTRVATWWPVHG